MTSFELVDAVGVEPTVFLMSQIYSLLSSPLDIRIHILLLVDNLLGSNQHLMLSA